ncbi:hypothetical protein PK35_00660 [Tamlana nanhaiensis]|uniref:DUF3826 domain-containing protein n=1 Tax=Neotamlana nanhaiensis TaxID=1382798 RepID=A0A0D7W997_9FLAO|nr:DUF3826 domain-containing protein [Tamlana nanhaiensis]KJD34357.1 hypothetical protein PK35_00660 [Tamlana nanhaiensis]
MSAKQLKQGLTLMFAFVAFTVTAQQHLDSEYIKVTVERASKIVKTLDISNEEKSEAVTQIIAKQYQNLSKYHDARDAKVDAIKSLGLEDEKEENKIAKAKKKSAKKIKKLHKSYVSQLNKVLSNDQVEAVKNGMTYGVLPKTYTAFLEMIPSLTDTQKEYIYNNLEEAREYAMDGGSSKEKHAWFGKYKGRINNYLSKEGYDLQKERDGWYERIEAQKQQANK